MVPITLRPLCDLRVELGAAIELGIGPRGRRRIIPITGGAVDGDRLRGRVLAFGADWQTILADSTAELDARYAIETHDGALIDVRNFGYRHGPQDVIERLARGEEVDPALYYMRTHPQFETGDPALSMAQPHYLCRHRQPPPRSRPHFDCRGAVIASGFVSRYWPS